MVKKLLFISCLLYLVKDGFAEIDVSKEIITPDGFSIFIPNSWGEIPGEVLAGYTETLNQMSPNIPEIIFDYGFQSKDAQNWFEYPYILVQIKDSGRLSKRRLKKFKYRESSAENLQRNLSSLVSSFKVGEVIYDPDYHILWSYVSGNVNSLGVINGLIAIIPTEEGFIQLSQYAMEAEFSIYLPLFQEIAKSIKVSERLKYKPRVTDSIPIISGIDFKLILDGVILGGMLGLIFILFNKKRKSPDAIIKGKG